MAAPFGGFLDFLGTLFSNGGGEATTISSGLMNTLGTAGDLASNIANVKSTMDASKMYKDMINLNKANYGLMMAEYNRQKDKETAMENNMSSAFSTATPYAPSTSYYTL